MLGKRKYDNVKDADGIIHTNASDDLSVLKRRKIDEEPTMYKYHECLPPKLHDSIKTEMRTWKDEFMTQLDNFYNLFEQKVNSKKTVTIEEWKSYEQTLQLILRYY
jgi:hypothetical protein